MRRVATIGSGDLFEAFTSTVKRKEDPRSIIMSAFTEPKFEFSQYEPFWAGSLIVPVWWSRIFHALLRSRVATRKPYDVGRD
jgi:hypothetical protein